MLCYCSPIDAKQIVLLVCVAAAMIAATFIIRKMTDR